MSAQDIQYYTNYYFNDDGNQDFDDFDDESVESLESAESADFDDDGNQDFDDQGSLDGSEMSLDGSEMSLDGSEMSLDGSEYDEVRAEKRRKNMKTLKIILIIVVVCIFLSIIIYVLFFKKDSSYSDSLQEHYTKDIDKEKRKISKNRKKIHYIRIYNKPKIIYN